MVQSISPKKLCELHQQNPVDLIDVRTPAEFGDTRASFARNIPLDRLDPKAVMAAKGADSSKPIYLICKSGGRSSQACKKFLDAGFQNVVDVEGGTLAWDAAGLPVIRGKKRCPSIDKCESWQGLWCSLEPYWATSSIRVGSHFLALSVRG